MILSKHSILFPWRIDKTVSSVLFLLAIIAAVIVIFVFIFLVKEAWPALNDGHWILFFEDEGWFPLENKYALLPMLWATLAAAFGAIIIAAPLGLACAVFQIFFAEGLVARIFRSLIGLLAGIPSVVYGLWGLTVLVPILAQLQPPGANLLAAILILSLMILPTVAITSASALATVPTQWLQGASALGMTRKGIIIGVAIPAARKSIFSGILLALARALGETMAVLMVAGNVVNMPSSLFDPVRVLTANIALEMAYAVDQHRASLFASGLLLTTLVFILAWLANRNAHNDAHIQR
ncbi:phosphate ABC transporter permease subunit PstC [Aurantivibrio infirmus]